MISTITPLEQTGGEVCKRFCVVVCNVCKQPLCTWRRHCKLTTRYQGNCGRKAVNSSCSLSRRCADQRRIRRVRCNLTTAHFGSISAFFPIRDAKVVNSLIPYGLTKILNSVELNCWIFQSYYLDFSKLSHGFVKIGTCICQN